MEKDKDLTYKKAITELESIIREMESENCDIDRLASYTSRATELLKYCRQSLFKTNEEVEKCLEELKAIAN